MNNRVLEVLDRVNPFLTPADEPQFDEEDFRDLARFSEAEKALVALASDGAAKPARRYAAAVALLQGPFPKWRSSSDDCRAVAAALAMAMRNDTNHNRWGLPGEFIGQLGEYLLSLSKGVIEALVPLLQEHAELRIEGSEAATLQSVAHYRISDLAADLLGRYCGVPWKVHADMSVRDEGIAALRAKLS